MNPLWLLVPILLGLAPPIVVHMYVRVRKHTGEMASAVVWHAIGTIIGLVWMAVGLSVLVFLGSIESLSGRTSPVRSA